MVLLPVDVGPSDCSLLVALRCSVLATQPLWRTDIGTGGSRPHLYEPPLRSDPWGHPLAFRPCTNNDATVRMGQQEGRRHGSV
jgi:hypothetical protein